MAKSFVVASKLAPTKRRRMAEWVSPNADSSRSQPSFHPATVVFAKMLRCRIVICV